MSLQIDTLVFYFGAMRILQINSAHDFGGGERHLADLSGGLQARRHRVFVALRPNAAWRGQLNFLDENSFIFAPLRNALDIQSAVRLAEFIRREKIEIVHAHLARDYPIAALAVRFSRTGARLILTRHVLFAMNRLHKLILPNDATFIAVSNAVRDRLVERKTAAPDRINVIRNAIDVERFARARDDFDRARFLEKFDLPNGKRFVGITGEINHNKGQLDFVRAAARVARAASDVNFIIVGADNSPRKQHLRQVEKLIAQSNLQTRVHFLGWQTDVAAVLCLLDVFVSASRSESFGLAIIEAMAANVPVVATRSAGAGEILTDGEIGKLVQIGAAEAMAAAIESFLNDENVSREFARKAQTAARTQFDLSRMIEETERIYRAASVDSGEE